MDLRFQDLTVKEAQRPYRVYQANEIVMEEVGLPEKDHHTSPKFGAQFRLKCFRPEFSACGSGSEYFPEQRLFALEYVCTLCRFCSSLSTLVLSTKRCLVLRRLW